MSRYQGSWGGGNRRGGGYQQGNSQYQQQQQQQQQTSDWRSIIKNDRSPQERPQWQLTCYGHERDKPNDITGDISPEEVRWANMLAVQQGATLHNIISEYSAAEKAKKEHFQYLQRVHKPPSRDNNPISSIPRISCTDWIERNKIDSALPDNRQPFSSSSMMMVNNSGSMAMNSNNNGSSGFGGAFGFGGGSTMSFGNSQQQQPTLSWGSPSAAAVVPTSMAPAIGQPQQTGFGGVFGATSSAHVFGQPQQQSSFGMNIQSNAIFGSSSGGGGGFGGVFGANSSFGQATTTTTTTASQPVGFGFGQQQHGTSLLNASDTAAMNMNNGPLGAIAGQRIENSAMPAAFGSHGGAVDMGTEVVVDEKEAQLWQSNEFERGKIPEHAPPSALCA